MENISNYNYYNCNFGAPSLFNAYLSQRSTHDDDDDENNEQQRFQISPWRNRNTLMLWEANKRLGNLACNQVTHLPNLQQMAAPSNASLAVT